MRMLHGLMASAALVAMPVTAFAQDTAQEQDEEQADVATDDGTTYGDTILVTATRRSQIAQDVPLAVTVVGGEQLENAGVVDVRGIRQVTPSLQATTGQSSATGVVLSIRGIGTAGDNPGFEPAVGVFVDGVFRSRAGLALAELPPIERVEVLRGPQGTLFGRNTSAGALSIITKGPEFNFGGYGEVTYGNYDELEVKAGVTGPLSQAFALRLDGGYHRRDGYIQDVNTDRAINNLDRYFVRGQGLYENEALTVRLIGDYAETDENCCGALNTNSGLTLNAANYFGTSDFTNVVIANAAAQVIQGFSALAGNVGLVAPFDPEGRKMAITPGRDYSEKVKEWGISGEINYDFGGMNLTSITAYRDWKALRDQDIDFSGLDRAYRDDYRTTLKDFTQEVRLQGTAFGDKLNWLVGGFYLNETLTLHDTVRFGAQADQYVDGLFNGITRQLLGGAGFQLYGTLAPPSVIPYFAGVKLPATPNGAGQVADDYTVKTDAFALFTHNIIDFNDQLSLTLGLRYNHESKEIDANLNSVVPACDFLGSSASAGYRTALTGNGLGAFILLACNPTVNSEFNGIYNGKRSENEFTGTAKLAFKITPDIMLYGGYDRGFKSGGYNLDRGTFDTVLLGGNGAQIEDLEFGNETVDAFEIGLKTQFSRAFTFNITGFYQDFKGYQSLRFEGTNFVVRQFDEVISQGVELEAMIRPISDFIVQLGYTYLDAKINDPLAPDNGQQLTNQPKHVVTGAMTWTPQLSDSVGGLVHVDFRQNSDSNVINDPLGVPFTANDGYGIWNARVGLNFADNRFGIEAYVENLFDTYYNITGFPVPEQGATYAVYPSPPRFYGVKVRASF
ncbi:MAG: TonB-dependent receptor [Sphingomonadales bacterium]|nr:TonB-dependent receptor [Sphingomonadales bacterium]